MKKFFLGFIVLFLLSASTRPAKASLLAVNNDGTITANVLGYDTESLDVKKLAGLGGATTGTITLENSDDQTKLTIASNGGERSLDVSHLDQEIIEVEESFSPQKLTISQKDRQFIITQGAVIASTPYAIKLSTGDHQFMLVAPSGHKFLSTLPLEAVTFLDSANIINRLAANTNLTISEDESGDLVYTITGEKIIKPLDLFEIIVPVVANVSATTGKVTKIDGPIWYRVFGFLLV